MHSTAMESRMKPFFVSQISSNPAGVFRPGSTFKHKPLCAWPPPAALLDTCPMPPLALPENAGLAFRGEPVQASARLTPAAAEKLLATRNPNGRPNADVVRRFAGWERGGIREHWLVDFPPHMDAQEAALYAEPFRRRVRAAAKDQALRNALARRERYLAAPVDEAEPHWTWLDAATVPDDTLLVVARDDDFSHGLLSARPFRAWWDQYHSRNEPAFVVQSYPFPWPPAKGLSDLSAAQEEHRHAIARAARSADGARLEAAIAAAYGWPGGLPDDEVLAWLGDLNRTRM